MKKRLAALAAFLMLAASLQLGVAPSASAATTCGDRYRWDLVNVNDGSLGADEWRIRFEIHYRFCKERGNDSDWWYVRANFSMGFYNAEGTHIGCGLSALNGLVHVRFNAYYWDGFGRNFNPGYFDVPCDPDSANHATQDYVLLDTPKLWFHNGEPPKFKANWKIEKTNALGLFEPDGVLSGLMRHCSGFASTPCPDL